MHMAWNAWEHIRVLIETYWNVNYMETGKNHQDFSVLIETYWNVNKIGALVIFRQSHVLIETYWNVNTVVSDSINFALPY